MESAQLYPVKVELFENRKVHVYQVNGESYLAGEDIGKMLGLADPLTSIRVG